MRIPPSWCLIFFSLTGFSANAAPTDDVTDFASLEKLAARLASEPYQPPAQNLDPFFEKLKYDDHRMIRFREDKNLFGGDRDRFSVQFFHPGWMFKKPVGFHALADGQSTPVPFDLSLFDYGKLQAPANVKPPEGYAGFKVLAPQSMLNRPFEFMVFMGASYFRAVTTQLGYGISARGVAVNTIGGKPEEFPDFTHFWLQEPKPGDKAFRLLALLNGPSITGAYEFESQPGEMTTMLIKATLHLRQPVAMLGIAPFSSMFWYGENSHPKPYDFRPEVHDSDGLQIEIDGGPTVWRPLDVGRDMRLSVFGMEKLKGFGLAERDRDFTNFEDLEARYHQRPSVWVEPVAGFGKGSVVLVELSTGEETWDNIVAMWQPAELPKTPAEPLHVEYLLNWLEEHQPGSLAKVTATRRGFVMDSDDHLYVLEFTKGSLDSAGKPKDWTPGIDVKVQGEARLVSQQVMANPVTGGWRAFFRLDLPESTNLLELSCELKDDAGQAASERWVYQWRR
jgi:glucans biosynthesis protein